MQEIKYKVDPNVPGIEKLNLVMQGLSSEHLKVKLLYLG